MMIELMTYPLVDVFYLGDWFPGSYRPFDSALVDLR